MNIELDSKLGKQKNMQWRKFNGDPVELPIFQAVEAAIIRETQQGYRLKVCIGTLTLILNLKVMMRYVKQWAISWVWALPSRLNQRPLPAPAVRIKW